MVMPIKKDFLAVYDYGQGGIWCVIHAQSKEEIEKKFPDLKVVIDHPNWMSNERFNEITKNRYLDIDEEVTGWFAGLKTNSLG